MATYFGPNGQIISAETGIAAERALEILVRMAATTDVVLLVWLAAAFLAPTLNRTFTYVVLGLFAFGMLLSTASWIPSTHTPTAVLLSSIAEHGSRTAGLMLLVTAGVLIWAIAVRLRHSIAR